MTVHPCSSIPTSSNTSGARIERGLQPDAVEPTSPRNHPRLVRALRREGLHPRSAFAGLE